MPESLGCARCGSCCESIWVPESLFYDLEHWSAAVDKAPNDTKRDAAQRNLESAIFAQKHWTRDTSEGSSPSVFGQVLVSCARYSRDQQLCLAHEGRPPVCSGYPWYDGKPGDTGAGRVANHCSYWLDVPRAERPPGARPLIPITAL